MNSATKKGLKKNHKICYLYFSRQTQGNIIQHRHTFIVSALVSKQPILIYYTSFTEICSILLSHGWFSCRCSYWFLDTGKINCLIHHDWQCCQVSFQLLYSSAAQIFVGVSLKTPSIVITYGISHALLGIMKNLNAKSIFAWMCMSLDFKKNLSKMQALPTPYSLIWAWNIKHTELPTSFSQHVSVSPLCSNRKLDIRHYSKLEQTRLHTERDFLSHGTTDVSEQCDTLCITLNVSYYSIYLHII